jgi:hypothetical protein
MRLALLALLALPVLAGVDGVVTNKTTNKPLPGAEVTLVKIGKDGMQPGGTVKTDASGKFVFPETLAGPALLQAVWQGVTYNAQVMPGMPLTGIQLDVFDVSPKPGAAQITQHMILVETDGKELVVNETVVFQNDSTATWQTPAGTLKLYVPPESAASLMAKATPPAGVALDREPKKTAEKGVYTLDFPIKPGGETRFDISYKMPVKEPLELIGRVLHGPSPVRLVVPQGIAVAGAGLSPIGTEPQTGAMIYDIQNADYRVKITGTGSLRATQPPAQQEEDGPRIEQIAPPGYARTWKLALALIVAFLALSFGLQWIRSPGGAAGR